MYWEKFKQKTEKRFSKKHLYSNVWGFQIQPETKWNPGLDTAELAKLEMLFGFELPDDYKAFLLTMNGFDRDQISIDPDETREDVFDRKLYRYPEDIDKGRWLVEEINAHRKYVNGPLLDAGFDVAQIVGFVPVYAHRALVVFKDKTLSPVISVHQGTDVIIYGKTLREYWNNELITSIF